MFRLLLECIESLCSDWISQLTTIGNVRSGRSDLYVEKVMSCYVEKGFSVNMLRDKMIWLSYLYVRSAFGFENLDQIAKQINRIDLNSFVQWFDGKIFKFICSIQITYMGEVKHFFLDLILIHLNECTRMLL